MSTTIIDTLLNVLKHNFVEDMKFSGRYVDEWDDAAQYVSIIDKLRRVGFKKLGNGHFSCVYTHKQLPDMVIKVSMKADCAYEKWLDFCEENPMDAVPVIHRREKWGIHSVVVLDRMEKCESFTDIAVRDLFETCVTGRLLFMVDIARTQRERNRLTELSGTPELYALAGRLVKPERVRWDLNMGNIMRRNGKYVITDPWCE